jgi:hypothetical protein
MSAWSSAASKTRARAETKKKGAVDQGSQMLRLPSRRLQIGIYFDVDIRQLIDIEALR